MKASKIVTIMISALLVSWGGYALAAQPIEPPFPANSKGHCSKDPSIIFTEEETAEFVNLKAAYLAEVAPLRSKLIDLRIKLRYSISDPQMQSRDLAGKLREIYGLQIKLENLYLSYRIKARAIFTKEQLERFPPDCPLKAGPGTGVGRWPFKEIR
jgi:hypothetical protein